MEYFYAGRNRQLERMVTLHQVFISIPYDLFKPMLALYRIEGAYHTLIVRLAGLDEMPLRLH